MSITVFKVELQTLNQRVIQIMSFCVVFFFFQLVLVLLILCIQKIYLFLTLLILNFIKAIQVVLIRAQNSKFIKKKKIFLLISIDLKLDNQFYKQNMKKIRGTGQIVPIYSPRSSYKRIKSTDQKMIADMTLNFDKLTINLLKEQFDKRNNQLTLNQFISIAKKHLKFWQTEIPNRELSLTRFLTFLFNEIDINGNGDMEWQQFTNYVIEKATVLKNLKSKADEVKHYVKSNVKPKIKIDGIIQKTEYIPDMDRVAFYEEGSNKIYLMNVQNGDIHSKILKINPKKLVVNISSVKKQKNGKVGIRKKDLVIPTDVRVLDMIYLTQKKYRILLVSTSDGFVRGWKYGQNGFFLANQPDNQQQLFQHYFSSEIYCLAWDHINQVLYCGQKNGSIYMWNLKTDLEKVLCESKQTNEKQGQQQKVNYMITCMITMPKLQFMASGRMDGKLILWDTINNKKKFVYKQHSRGILTLAFNQSMILLFSAGFDHKICIWNPYISTLIHKIEGHLAPILSLRVIEGSHQLISMDSQGIVKMTDTRRFNFIYSFSVETSQQRQNGSLSSFIVINKPLKLVFAGKSISVYEYDKNYNPHTADQNTAICCKYVKENLCFFTPMGNKIKVWSALNGDIERIYMDISPNEISTFEFDFLKKRMVVGDTKGNITLHNTANGAKMKTLTKHSAEITHLIATQNDNKNDIFISSALDNQLRICKETQESFEVIRTIYIRKDAAITCLQYCQKNKLIMVGTNVGTLAFYQLQTGKTAGTCLNKPHEQFTSICKTSQPIIIATTSTGKISIIAMPPLPNRFQKLISFYHTDCQKVNYPLGVRSSCFSSKLKKIFVIDDKMYLTSYNLKDLGQSLLNEDFTQKEKTQSSRRSTLTKALEDVVIKKQWQIKTHSEIVKSVEIAEEQQLVITTSFDKKVKIWSAIDGRLLDSLQQNYNKAESVPIAYYDSRQQMLFSRDKKIAIPNVKIDPIRLQFDPFLFEDVVQYHEQFKKNMSSNRQWKIFINFRDVVQEEMEGFSKLAKQIQDNQEEYMEVSNKENVDLQEITNKLKDKRMMLKNMSENVKANQKYQSVPQFNRIFNQDFNKIHSFKEKAIQFGSSINQSSSQNFNSHPLNLKNQGQMRISNNYFKRSILKCIKKFIDKNQTEGEAELISQDKSKAFSGNRDYVPIYEMIKNSQRNKSQQIEHKKHIENLYRQETQSIANGRTEMTIKMSRDQAQSAERLCKLLMKTDSRATRPQNLFKNIQIKQRKLPSLQ